MVINNLAIVQARTGSKRFPSKILKKINNKTLIEILLYRLSKSKKIDKIIIATTRLKEDDILVDLIDKLGFEIFRGNENDVLERYYKAAQKYKAKSIIRVTGDCPLVDSIIVDQIIDLYSEGNFDYVSNTINPTFPDGMDVEVFKFKALKLAQKNARTKYDREHVTPYLKNKKNLLKKNYTFNEDLSKLRLTVDVYNDYVNIKNIYKYFNNNFDISFNKIISVHKKNKNFIDNDLNIERNIGSNMNVGNKLWYRAKHIIPGGNMILSKRPDQFLPGEWPTYFSKSKGCYIWDIDNKKYLDLSLMGVGTNILGYGNIKVDNKVREVVANGNMSTFNCFEEVLLAEKLVELHPWSEMAKFCRTGGEANALAIRIARATSEKDNVAVCGYHGWHDWYLASNLKNKKNLNTHLLEGLETKGVNKSLKNTIYTFDYNDFKKLKWLVENKNIGVIKMEVMRNYPPENNFLQKIRKLATINKIVLIFDECTSGFRETYGGLHLKHKVYPDIAIFGKALGNGYAINAIIGRRDVMENAQKSFISSTFWSERIGPTAALETLKVMKEKQSWRYITNIGNKYHSSLKAIAKRNKIDISTYGLSSLKSFKFNDKNHLIFKTYLTQEMLKRKILATNSIYFCTEHNMNKLDRYFNILDEIFKNIYKAIESNNEKNLLDGDQCSTGFTRVN